MGINDSPLSRDARRDELLFAEALAKPVAEGDGRILIDRVRLKQAQRRGGGADRLDVPEIEVAAPVGDDQLLAVEDALNRLTLADPAKAELVKLRFFVGLTLQQSSQIMNISDPTAKRWWAYAKAWLYREMTSSGR